MRWNYALKCIWKGIAFVGIVGLGLASLSMRWGHGYSNSSRQERNQLVRGGIIYQHGQDTYELLVKGSGASSMGEDSGVDVHMPKRWQAAGNSPSSNPNNNSELLHAITHRYWALLRRDPANSTTNSTDDLGPRFFTEERLLNLAEFSLFRPNLNSRRSLGSIFAGEDRIVAQILLGLEGLPSVPSAPSSALKTKNIQLYNGFHSFYYTGDGDLGKECPRFQLNKCLLKNGKKGLRQADVVIVSASILHSSGTAANFRRQKGIGPNTKLLFYMLESPYVEQVKIIDSAVDWLGTYWSGADIVTPYGKWVYYDPLVTQKPQSINYAAGKTKLGAMFVSNCYANNGRLGLVQQLQKLMAIDVYGNCGTLTCYRNNETTCFEKLKKDYKFYFAFENSNCDDYITEKLFHNALWNNVVPVVFGGSSPADYVAAAPANSFIHVQSYGSLAELASYLKWLDGNDEAYNAYFAWKGTGVQIDTSFFCRVCTMAHYSDYLEKKLGAVELRARRRGSRDDGGDDDGEEEGPLVVNVDKFCNANLIKGRR